MRRLAPLKIFFSWQSELPRKTTTLPIERALQQAATKVLNEDGAVVEIQSGPEREGAVLIAQSIAKQIVECDLYVADVSLVDRNDGRLSPNANVMFELGLAVGRQGWKRVVLLLNKQTGNPEDLPFDLRGHTVVAFNYREAQDKSDVAQLTNVLVREFRRVLRDSPDRPRGHDEAEIRRARDIVQLNRLFSVINRSMMDRHLREGPQHRHVDMARVYDMAAEVVDSSAFRLSDTNLEKRIRQMMESFDRSLECDEFYQDTSLEGVESFGLKHTSISHGLLNLGPQIKAEEALRRAYSGLRIHWSALLDLVHKSYLELDLAATDLAALKALEVDDDED